MVTLYPGSTESGNRQRARSVSLRARAAAAGPRPMFPPKTNVKNTRDIPIWTFPKLEGMYATLTIPALAKAP